MLQLGVGSAGARTADDPDDGLLNGGLLDDGLGSGNDIGVDVDLPVTVCGNGIAVLGDASGSCSTAPPADSGPPASDGGGSGDGVLSDNTVSLDVDLPVTVCGNGVAVLGDASGSCSVAPAPPAPAPPSGGGGSGGGVLSGNGIGVDVNAPVTVCGNSVAVLGDASGSCTQGSGTPPPETPPTTPPTTPPVTPPTGPPGTPPSHDGLPGSALMSAREGMSALSSGGSSFSTRSAGQSGGGSSGSGGLSSLPFTGLAIAAAVPLGAGLLIAGTAMMLGSRRRIAAS